MTTKPYCFYDQYSYERCVGAGNQRYRGFAQSSAGVLVWDSDVLVWDSDVLVWEPCTFIAQNTPCMMCWSGNIHFIDVLQRENDKKRKRFPGVKPVKQACNTILM
ncbi:TPA: hypothetical protein MDX48_003292 [Klebsiella quasipneumoniae]|nr:hypothetical protein [Klebsiella quasipneumoniae]